MRLRTLVALGIILTVAGWWLQHLAAESWLSQFLAPRFSAATEGYRVLLTRSMLFRQEPGFPEILDLAAASDARAALLNPDTIRRVGGAVLTLEPLTVGGRRAGPTVEVALMSAGTTLLSVRIWDPEKEIRIRFFDNTVGLYGAIIFWLGVALSIAVLMVTVRSERKGQRRPQS